VSQSVLATLPPATVSAFLAGAQRRRYAPGVVGYQAGQSPRVTGLVLAGLLRLYVDAPDGRQVTIRYGHPGDFLGVVAVADPQSALCAQSVTECELLAVDPDHFARLTRQDAALAWAFLRQAAQYHSEMLRLFTRTTFGTIRQRVAAHLLDLVVEESPMAPLRAAVRQQALADAVGSTREVVARALRELRADGLVETSRRGIAVLDPERLAAEAEGSASP
jgi:CRP/FNR family transcriptional regulator